MCTCTTLLLILILIFIYLDVRSCSSLLIVYTPKNVYTVITPRVHEYAPGKFTAVMLSSHIAPRT